MGPAKRLEITVGKRAPRIPTPGGMRRKKDRQLALIEPAVINPVSTEIAQRRD
jgi:hypothetical protein